MSHTKLPKYIYWSHKLAFCPNNNTANDISTTITARKLMMPLDSDFSLICIM
jgi:hypothetical protein